MIAEPATTKETSAAATSLPEIDTSEMSFDAARPAAAGSFKTVYRGLWRGADVAVLRWTGCGADGLLDEAQILARVGQHQNVNALLGVCSTTVAVTERSW